MAKTLEEFNRVLKHVWSEPKSLVAFGGPGPLVALVRGEPYEPLDPDWWEPRYDAPWRRQYARDRAEFGGAYVAAPQEPVEGPNNPNRLRRELEDAERDVRIAKERSFEADVEKIDAKQRLAYLEQRLEEVA